MTNDLLQIKLRQRLNKLSSNDFDNLECWQIIEAFNKSQLQWCRRQLHGMNQFKEGEERSHRRIDDLSSLLVEANLTGSENQSYFESNGLPEDYLEYKRLSTHAKGECCKDPYSMTVYLVEEANIDLILSIPAKWIKDVSVETIKSN